MGMKTAVLLIALVLESVWTLPAFPGAEGWGSQNIGGRGGKVYIVTNTNNNGPGSFSAALTAPGARYIVFRVSGVITITTIPELVKNNSNITIAGQTSPGGITLKCASSGEGPFFTYQSNFHDMILRFVRFRSRASTDHALMLNAAHNFIIDHCDFSGGSDECLDICSSDSFTLSWNTIANSSAGQTYGLLMAYLPTSNISMHHCLFAHHVERFPEMHWGDQVPPNNGMIDMVNNVLYDGEAYFFSNYQSAAPSSCRLNYVGNYLKAGPSSPPNGKNSADWFWNMVSLGGSMTGYEADNEMVRGSEVNRTTIRNRMPNRVDTPWENPPVTTWSADQAYIKVADKVGAWPRDPMNLRTINDLKNATGVLRKDDDALITTGPNPPADADLDGMPDYWEDAMGLNKNDPSDAIKDFDNSGYNNIEKYFNDLANILLGEQPVYPNTGIEEVRSGGMGAPSPVALSPNPCVGSSQVQISLLTRRSHPLSGKVRVVDIGGKIMAEFPVSRHTSWNGRDKLGHSLAAGVYLVQWMKEGRLAGERKMTLVR